MKNITIYSTPNCHFCHAAKDFLTAHKVHFIDIDVTQDQARKAEMIEMTGQMGVPVIKIDEEGKDPIVMVGFDQNLLAHSAGIAA